MEANQTIMKSYLSPQQLKFALERDFHDKPLYNGNISSR